MNCINCGALLTDMDYCPHCGSDVMVQKKAYYLANLYYNQGLEKASIRDLSGAISCLRRSLTFHKYHIQARNLLGLVYFETGEVVSALSEWVISKNLKPKGNLAEEYIKTLQANPNKLAAISESIRKYNHALAYCREGHEDMAMIQLKKVLAQNPQLIKGYHLLALLQIREKSYGKARRTLKKAARIDKTNTTTLRFLREVDEQTGVSTHLEKRDREEEERIGRQVRIRSGNDVVIQPQDFRDNSMVASAVTFFIGILLGAVALWFLIVPSITQDIHQQANEQVKEYSDAIASKEAELEVLRTQAEEAQASGEEQAAQQISAQNTMASYDNLIVAYQRANTYDENGEIDREGVISALSQVSKGLLSLDAQPLYDGIVTNLGITQEELNPSAAPEGEAGASGEGEGSGEGEEDY